MTTLDLTARRAAALAEPELPATTPTPVDLSMSRRVVFPVQIFDPNEGVVRDVELESVVPDGKAIAGINREVARLSGGVAWQLQPADALGRAIMLGTVLFQCPSIPEWLYARLEEDMEALVAIYGGLSEHRARYFRHGRDSEAGEGAPQSPSVVVGAPKPAAS